MRHFVLLFLASVIGIAAGQTTTFAPTVGDEQEKGGEVALVVLVSVGFACLTSCLFYYWLENCYETPEEKQYAMAKTAEHEMEAAAAASNSNNNDDNNNEKAQDQSETQKDELVVAAENIEMVAVGDNQA